MTKKKLVFYVIVISVAAVLVTAIVAPKYTLAVAAIMPGTPP